VSTDWVGVIDEWAGRFFHELDYVREANTAKTFKLQMAPLEGITVPEVVMPLTTREVLTTQWVEGPCPMHPGSSPAGAIAVIP
jgi:aarF domain-containing kinase